MSKTVYSGKRTFECEANARRWRGIPAYIKITTRPATIQYTDGDDILFTGIAVTVYDENDTPLGKLREDELVFPVTVAKHGSDLNHYTDGHGVNSMRLITDTLGWDFHARQTWYYYGGSLGKNSATFHTTDVPSAVFVTYYNGDRYAACEYGSLSLGYGYMDDNGYHGRGSFVINGESGDGVFKRCYTQFPSYNTDYTRVPVSTVDPTGKRYSELSNDSEIIPVQWINPYNGETLEDTYEVFVDEAEE